MLNHTLRIKQRILVAFLALTLTLVWLAPTTFAGYGVGYDTMTGLAGYAEFNMGKGLTFAYEQGIFHFDRYLNGFGASRLRYHFQPKHLGPYIGLRTGFLYVYDKHRSGASPTIGLQAGYSIAPTATSRLAVGLTFGQYEYTGAKHLSLGIAFRMLLPE